ncbi:hypothetical protein ACIBVL_37050 [Streptomyces sp. NPDC049687]|uniref:hypothetical protein n=1 Tax=Streptomyces sp. NPDC049687 TaxID=3365596 RepID=UPI0037954E6D
MIQPIAALGAATVTVSGCVWYLPALADLRAGADRPDSRRTAAAACLSGWSTTGIIALLLFAAEAWWMPVAVALAGAAVTVGLRTRATVQRRREARQAARDWAELRTGRRPTGTDRTRHVVAVLLACGLLTAAIAAAVELATAGAEDTDRVSAAAVPAGIVSLFIALAVLCTRMARRRTGADRAR